MKGTVYIQVGYCDCGCGIVHLGNVNSYMMKPVMVGVPAEALLSEPIGKSYVLRSAVRRELYTLGLLLDF